MALWVPLICSRAVQSLPHPGAPKGDGPGPDLQRLHWPTAAHRVPANNCTKNALAPSFLSWTRASARNFTFPLALCRSFRPERLASIYGETYLSLQSQLPGDEGRLSDSIRATSGPLKHLNRFLSSQGWGSNQTENDTTLSGKTPTNQVC